MDYSPKSPTKRTDGVQQPLVGAYVLQTDAPGKGDLSDWVALMEVVEALCPEWPTAPIEKRGGYRL